MNYKGLMDGWHGDEHLTDDKSTFDDDYYDENIENELEK